MKSAFALLVILLATSWAEAQNVQVLSVTHRGNGCPVGAASHAFAPDNSSLTILYGAMNVELDGVTPRQTDKKSCWTTINLNLNGKQIIIDGADYRGFYSLGDANSGVIFRSVYFFQNGAAKVFGSYVAPWNAAGGIRKTALGPAEENFVWNTQNNGILQLSPCGGATTLNILNQALVSTSVGAQGQATFDSMDTNLTTQIRLRVVPCQYRFNPYRGPSIITPASELRGTDGPIWNAM